MIKKEKICDKCGSTISGEYATFSMQFGRTRRPERCQLCFTCVKSLIDTNWFYIPGTFTKWKNDIEQPLTKDPSYDAVTEKPAA